MVSLLPLKVAGLDTTANIMLLYRQLVSVLPMIAALMEYANYLARAREAGPVDRDAWDEALRHLIIMLAPSVPHIAEELWERTGRPYSVHTQAWPAWDEALARAETYTLVVQVNGKLRDRIEVPADTLAQIISNAEPGVPTAGAEIPESDGLNVPKENAPVTATFTSSDGATVSTTTSRTTGLSFTESDFSMAGSISEGWSTRSPTQPMASASIG